MTQPGFHVDVEQLRTHAKSLTEAGSGLDLAADAGGQVSGANWNLAFGVMCQPLALVLQPVAQFYLSLMRELSSSAETIQKRLGDAADRYAQNDHEAQKTMNGFHDAPALTKAPPGEQQKEKCE